MIRGGGAIATMMLIGTVAFGCSKSDSPRAPALASSTPVPSASALSADASAADGGAKAAVNAEVTWTGSYDATAGTMYVPEGKEWEGVKFRGEKSELGLGKGELRLTSDARGRVVGTVDGPLGPLTVSGLLQGERLTARLDPKDPAGFTGTLEGTVAGTGPAATVAGKMFLSQSEARVIREASFALKRN